MVPSKCPDLESRPQATHPTTRREDLGHREYAGSRKARGFLLTTPQSRVLTAELEIGRNQLGLRNCFVQTQDFGFHQLPPPVPPTASVQRTLVGAGPDSQWEEAALCPTLLSPFSLSEGAAARVPSRTL